MVIIVVSNKFHKEILSTSTSKPMRPVKSSAVLSLFHGSKAKKKNPKMTSLLLSEQSLL